jgi:hypothetical protein
MDKSDASEAGPAHPFSRKGRYCEPVVIAHNNIFDKAPAIYDKADLPRNLF